jgi:soluble lytic murein transglycosylase
VALAALLVLAGTGYPSEAPGNVPRLGPPARPGLALRAALEAAGRGDVDTADALFTRVDERHPEVGDYATLLQVQALLEAERPVDAVVVGESGLRRHRRSRLHARMLGALGEAYLSVGAEPAARNVWTLALGETATPSVRAGFLLQLGESYERGGLVDDAASAYRELWRLYPGEPESELAGQRLDALEAETGRPLRTPADRLQLADAYYELRRNDEALEAYRAALDVGLPSQERRRAKRRVASTLFRLRRYPEAATAYREVGKEPEARIQHARAVARAGDSDRAVSLLEKLARSLRGSYADRSRYLAALLLESQPPDPRANAHFARLAQSARDRDIRRDARWRLAWAAYSTGTWPEALYHLETLERATSDPIALLQARYWRARTLEHLGDERAAGLFEAIAAEYPLTYYGWRSAGRLAFREVPAALGKPPRQASARIRPAELERVRALIEAGLESDARDEIAALARRSLSFGDRLELAELATDAGDANRAQRLVVDAYQEPLAQGPRPGLEELWWLAWPWVLAEVDGGAPVDTELVYAVMREESGYRPKVVSLVGARGLLQIMPETGQRLATDLGMPFDPDDLFDPAINVRLGSYYLAQLLARFGGRESAAIGSYNAGPQAVSRWLDERGSLPDDEWVETIPYSQTRSYVKRVLRSQWAYRTLY